MNKLRRGEIKQQNDGGTVARWQSQSQGSEIPVPDVSQKSLLFPSHICSRLRHDFLLERIVWTIVFTRKISFFCQEGIKAELPQRDVSYNYQEQLCMYMQQGTLLLLR